MESVQQLPSFIAQLQPKAKSAHAHAHAHANAHAHHSIRPPANTRRWGANISNRRVMIQALSQLNFIELG